MLATFIGVARRPSLWPVAIRQLLRMAPRGWWRQPPFLPVPDRAYREFRSLTQYGDPRQEAEPRDVIAWLEWCRERGSRIP